MKGKLAEFDYIVCGAGSAGCVLAARLSENPDTRVLLLEAGPGNADPLLRVPLMAGAMFRGRRYNWSYVTEPVPGLNGRRVNWARGKVLGGSSSINGMVYSRGLPSDFDAGLRADSGVGRLMTCCLTSAALKISAVPQTNDTLRAARCP